MLTTPEQVRRGLQAVTTAGLAEVATVVTASRTPATTRAALFVAAPLIVGEYGLAAGALASDWYDELRADAPVRAVYTPEVVAPVREEYLGNAVAWATQSLVDFEAEVERGTNDMLNRLEPVLQREIAMGFWNTMTSNVKSDPDAIGWQRFARGGACSFCRMLADKGAVYRKDTANFAAHRACHCTAGPAFGSDSGPEASVMQYTASSKRRTPEQQAALREYLKTHYGA